MPTSWIRYSSRLLWACVCCCCICTAHAGQEDPPVAQKGLIDLRTTNLSGKPVALKGAWAFYWKQLLSPANTTANLTGFVDFPQRWQNTPVNNTEFPAKGYASYKLTVLLPSHQNKLALEIGDAYTSYRLFVNNTELAAAGSPGTTAESTVPKWLIKTVEITDPSDTLHLILQVANFQHSKGGPYKDIKIGDKDRMFSDRDENMALDLLLTGCLFMCGLFFIGLFLFGKYDKAILFFSLFCITYSYRIAGAGFYVFHTIFPDIPWIITLHLEYLTLFISIVFFSLYTMHLYPEDTNPVIMHVEMGTCLAMAAVVILFPPFVFTRLINPFLVVMFFVIAYAFYVYIKAMKHKRLGAKYALMSTAVVLVVFVMINLQYFGIIAPQKAVLFAGYILFFFLQSLVLSFRFTYMLNKARKDAEQGLMAKSEFLSTMSHEIRTPLNSVIGLSHILLDNKPREDQKEQLNVLLFSANNLLSIVNDILDYNKIEAGKVHFESIEIDLRQVAKDIVAASKTAADNKGIALRLNTDPAFQAKLTGDPTRLSQVIGNLLQNAIKFTRKGYVALNISQERVTQHHVTIRISVEDTGIGIAQEKQKLIFERFTQADTSTSRSFGGTGLGLAICKKILELQGSSLQLQSEPGKGSVFYFIQTFPISRAEAVPGTTPTQEIPLAKKQTLDGIHILLVEDNEMNILVAKTFLEKWGARIDVAMNGQEAIDMLDAEKHQLVLMDMHMPVMDGYEALRIIRERGIQVPVIALTASLPAEVEQRSNGLRIDEIVTKPFVPAPFLKTILKLVHHQELAGDPTSSSAKSTTATSFISDLRSEI